mmetsp:Transcript_30589/g.69865  ORF Transcript_30589/g.69865 Transcript_30589/m.69865 type:complete len:355 (-) Transcript_30589:973-2037(-)
MSSSYRQSHQSGPCRRSTVSSDCYARMRTDLELEARRAAACPPSSPAGSLDINLITPVRGSTGVAGSSGSCQYVRGLSVSSIGLADAFFGGEDDDAPSESGGSREDTDENIAVEMQLMQLARSAEQSLLEQAAFRGGRRASDGDETLRRTGGQCPSQRESSRSRERSESDTTDTSRQPHGASDFDVSAMSLMDINVESPKELELLLGRGDIPKDDASSASTADERARSTTALLLSKDNEIARLRDRLEQQDDQIARQRAVNRMLLDELRSDGAESHGRLRRAEDENRKLLALLARVGVPSPAMAAELEGTRRENRRLARENERLRRRAGEGGGGDAAAGPTGSVEGADELVPRT